MTDDQPTMESKRRTFLKTVGMLGAAAAVGSTTTGSVAAESHLDSYHQALRSDLTGRGGNRTLPDGEYVIATDEGAALDAFTYPGPGSVQSVDVSTDAVPITTGERVVVGGNPDSPDDATYEASVSGSFSDGDKLLGVAYLRSDDEDAEVRAAFRYGDGDNQVARSAHVEPSGQWMRYFFPIEVSTGSGTPTFAFELGYKNQRVEFAGLALIDYGTQVSLGTLPPYDYAGRAEDADWREAAQQRIEAHRKADIEVEVLDPDGNPVEGAAVDVSMTEHAFDFGTAVSMEHINGDSEDDQRYKDIVRNKFNKAVIENGLKYPHFLGPWDTSKEDAKNALEWLNEHNIPTRGHYLLWEEFDAGYGGGMSIQNPGEMTGKELSQAIETQITNHASDVGDMVTEWDMHNHPVWQSNFRDDDGDGLGWEDVNQWWQAANEATEQPLYTNEMGQVGGTWQQSGYLDFLDHLVENDYPIDGIGFMGHHQQKWNQMMDMSRLEGVYDTYDEKYDLPILITEFDIQIFSRRNAQDVSVQTDYTRDFLTMTFSKPNVEGIMSWGFWADDHWRPTGAYYNSDWSLRPNGETYMDLVYEEWWTDESGRTDSEGVYATRGFKGDYEITARSGKLSGQATVSLTDGGSSVTIELSPGQLPGGAGKATDPDDDGLFEDVDGDGDTDMDDVRTFGRNIRHADVQTPAFDFDGDGDVDSIDLVELFFEVQ
ncbi:MAG: endo-1,4-beta-xylanase [Halorhabdus sp.]